jgi:hypothetical protein
MDRRQFLLTAAAVAPILTQHPRYQPKYRFTRMEGDTLIWEMPFAPLHRIRFEANRVVIKALWPEDTRHYTMLHHRDDRWTLIEDRTRYRPDELPGESDMPNMMANGLRQFTMALVYALSEPPGWWAGRPLLQRTLDSTAGRSWAEIPIADFG